jgi:hypothetical protein
VSGGQTNNFKITAYHRLRLSDQLFCFLFILTPSATKLRFAPGANEFYIRIGIKERNECFCVQNDRGGLCDDVTTSIISNRSGLITLTHPDMRLFSIFCTFPSVIRQHTDRTINALLPYWIKKNCWINHQKLKPFVFYQNWYRSVSQYLLKAVIKSILYPAVEFLLLLHRVQVVFLASSLIIEIWWPMPRFFRNPTLSHSVINCRAFLHCQQRFYL